MKNIVISKQQTNYSIDNGSFDNCGIQSMTMSKTNFNCDNLGENTITLTAIDASGNSNSAIAIITVVDTISPTVITQNIRVALDANGAATITPEQIDNASTDNCGIASYALDKTTFTCANLGTNQVKLTVTDNSGNIAIGNATVTVVDTTSPAVITQNIQSQSALMDLSQLHQSRLIMALLIIVQLKAFSLTKTYSIILT